MLPLAIASIVGISVGILLGLGVWSLVVQQVALWTAKVAVVTIASGWRPHLVFSQDILKEQMAFGSRLNWDPELFPLSLEISTTC